MSSVDEIKRRIDVVDVIGESVRLQRAGRSFKGLCPFHTEKTPSFIVSPDRQTWHCFGACGTGGDVITFVMKRDGLAFVDALETLARRAGITIERRRPEQTEERNRLVEANEAAALFYHHVLTEAAEAGPARAYLRQRGLDDAILERFQIGFAPLAFEPLITYLRQRGFGDQELLDAGLASLGDHGLYDRFRGRVMFPIHDDRGRAVGFGGRTLPGDDDGEPRRPKYLNTPQTPLFDKSGLLYAFDLAREAIRSEGCAVIVEGYMDAIAAHQSGFANVVASMGTALTEKQVVLLKRVTKNVILALDADTAGSEATLRGVQVVAEAADRESVPVPTWQGIIRQQKTLAADIKVMTLPEGRDPDDVIRSDQALWSELARNAKPVLDHLFNVTVQRARDLPPAERFQLIEAFLPNVVAIPDPSLRAQYLDRLLARAGLAPPDQDELKRALRRASRPASARRPEASAPEAPQPSRPLVRDAREEFCLALLFGYPALRERGSQIQPDLFTLAENRELFLAWLDERDAEALGAALDENLREHLQRALARPMPPFDERQQHEALESCLWGIEQERLRLRKRETVLALADVEERLSPSRLVESIPLEDGAPDDETEPARVLVEDMEAGRLVHARILELKRNAQPGESGE